MLFHCQPWVYITTAIWRCRKPLSQWQPSFHMKAALPLANRLATASDCSRDTCPWYWNNNTVVRIFMMLSGASDVNRRINHATTIHITMTSWNGTFSALPTLCEGEPPVRRRWIPFSKASDAELWCLMYNWTNGWANNQDAGDLRRNCAHYDVTVMYDISHLQTQTK